MCEPSHKTPNQGDLLSERGILENLLINTLSFIPIVTARFRQRTSIVGAIARNSKSPPFSLRQDFGRGLDASKSCTRFNSGIALISVFQNSCPLVINCWTTSSLFGLTVLKACQVARLPCIKYKSIA